MNASTAFSGPSVTVGVTGEGVSFDPLTGHILIETAKLTGGVTINLTATGSDGAITGRYKLLLSGAVEAQEPRDPDAPAEPETPEEPETPAEPEVPEEPETPAEPETPKEPETPSGPPVPAAARDGDWSLNQYFESRRAVA